MKAWTLSCVSADGNHLCLIPLLPIVFANGDSLCNSPLKAAVGGQEEYQLSDV